jgi:hypothetical protein
MQERAATEGKAAPGGIAGMAVLVALFAGLLLFSIVPSCGEITTAPGDLCVGACDAGPCTQNALRSAGDHAQAQCGTGAPTADAGAPPAAAPPPDVLVPACTICRRAENCCKAAGRLDCGYTAACANASTTDEQSQILVFCYALVDSGHDPAGHRCGEY